MTRLIGDSSGGKRERGEGRVAQAEAERRSLRLADLRSWNAFYRGLSLDNLAFYDATTGWDANYHQRASGG